MFHLQEDLTRFEALSGKWEVEFSRVPVPKCSDSIQGQRTATENSEQGTADRGRAQSAATASRDRGAWKREKGRKGERESSEFGIRNSELHRSLQPGDTSGCSLREKPRAAEVPSLALCDSLASKKRRSFGYTMRKVAPLGNNARKRATGGGDSGKGKAGFQSARCPLRANVQAGSLHHNHRQ